MRRAEKVPHVLPTDRVLRRRRIAETARTAEIAEEVEWSPMTMRRCIEDLEAMGVPIEAERGVGHRLKDYDIPGWFTEDETSAMLLGLGVMKEWSDKELADAATSALGKIGDALPRELHPTFEDKRFKAKLPWNAPKPKVDLAVIRRAVKAKGRLAPLESATSWRVDQPEGGRRVLPPCRRRALARSRQEIEYVNENGKKSRRVINPLELRIYPPWVVIAWCEERENVRMFRVDRMKRVGDAP